MQVLGWGDENGDTALHHAVAAGHTDIVEMLAAFMSPSALSQANARGQAPIHVAVTANAVSWQRLSR